MILTTKEFLKKGFEPKHLISILCLLVLLVSKPFFETNFLISILATVFLGVSVMTSVHHAEIIAHKIGEGLGTLVLALSVTIIEVGLIVSLMGQVTDGANVLARDTVFAAVMIITNGMVALCLILGGLKYKEQEFQVQGSKSLLVVLVTLAILVFVLPNYTSTTAGPTYNPLQLGFIGIICILLYLLFIFLQTTTHKAYFEPTMEKDVISETPIVEHEISKVDAWLSFISLCVSLIAVIGLAKLISPIIESGIAYIGAPKSTVGLIIAAIVLAPETWAAANASRANRLQTSLNLALGSGIASIALTIPVVIAYSMFEGKELVLGLDPKNMVFLTMTFFVGAITLGTGKSTLLQGAVHGVILLTYFVMSFVP
ncbi:calcium:proton antiporter [Bdellovibrio sp.]|uniref:calcium:proton antiporter n=1 Tax=Bdellovibrio sp. TaxID=28201 RepID=UPI0039E41369